MPNADFFVANHATDPPAGRVARLLHYDTAAGAWVDGPIIATEIDPDRGVQFYMLDPNYLDPAAPPTAGASIHDAVGRAAQGESDPTWLFKDHALLEYAGKLYDPSCSGQKFDDKDQWAASSLSGARVYDVKSLAAPSAGGIFLVAVPLGTPNALVVFVYPYYHF